MRSTQAGGKLGQIFDLLLIYSTCTRLDCARAHEIYDVSPVFVYEIIWSCYCMLPRFLHPEPLSNNLIQLYITIF